MSSNQTHSPNQMSSNHSNRFNLKSNSDSNQSHQTHRNLILSRGNTNPQITHPASDQSAPGLSQDTDFNISLPPHFALLGGAGAEITNFKKKKNTVPFNRPFHIWRGAIAQKKRRMVTSVLPLLVQTGPVAFKVGSKLPFLQTHVQIIY